MSNKYFWNGVDISDLTGTTNTGTVGAFVNFPGNTSEVAPLTSQPTEFSTNAGNFTNITENKSWFCYRDDELAPPFSENGENIFTKNYSTNSNLKKILVKYDYFNSGSGTINIPEWCNAVKFFFTSKDGSVGNGGSGLNGGPGHNYDHDLQENERHRGRGNNPNHHWHHKHTHQHHHNNWAARSGGSGGNGGTAMVGWFLKYIQFTAGPNNTIEYSISSGNSGTSSAKVKSAGVTVAQYTFKNGAKGGTGTNASGPHHNQTANYHQYNVNLYRQNSNDTFNAYHYHHQDSYSAGSSNGQKGSTGTHGSCNISNSGTGEYLIYRQANTNNSQLWTYYFKYE